MALIHDYFMVLSATAVPFLLYIAWLVLIHSKTLYISIDHRFNTFFALTLSAVCYAFVFMYNYKKAQEELAGQQPNGEESSNLKKGQSIELN